MTEIATAADGAAFKDRKVGLIVFGIFQILLGALCALLVPLMILASLVDKNASSGMNFTAMASGMLFYAFLAAWFITMGIGSLRARRWARALSLIFSWLWLVCGIGGLLFMILFMSDMYTKMGQNGQMPPGVARIAQFVMMGTLSVIYVILPGIFVFFYQSHHVKATCDARDAQTRWTDQCPLPVLALSLMFWSWAASTLFMAFHNWVVPFFGHILSGRAGAACIFAAAALSAYVAWGSYRLRVAAWWCAAVIAAVWGVSTIITFARIDLFDLYRKMNVPAGQIETMKQFGMPQGEAMIGFALAWFVGFLVYLLYTKKYFKPATQI